MSTLITPCHDQEFLLNTPNRNVILKNGLPRRLQVHILGQGSYGVVCKAVYKGRPVAVKIIKNKTCQHSQIMKNEANILGWHHNNIVQLLKVEDTPDYGILIMERFSGKGLQTVCECYELSLHDRICITLDIVNALIYCHKKYILHMDLKPENVLVAISISSSTSSTRPKMGYSCKLCDFGSSFCLKENTYQKLLGTIRYMSPEILRGLSPSPSVDIFSLGVVMWQLKYRVLPYFWIDSNDSVAYQVVKNDLRPNMVPHQKEIYKNSKIPSENVAQPLKKIDEIFSSSNLEVYPIETAQKICQSKICKMKPNNLNYMFQKVLVEDKQNFNRTVGLNLEILEPIKLGKSANLKPRPTAEDLYDELFSECWRKDATFRPTAINLKRRLILLIRQ